jgi:hypothetical protein
MTIWLVQSQVLLIVQIFAFLIDESIRNWRNLNNQLEMQETRRSNDLRPVQLHDYGAGRSLGLRPAPISIVYLLHSYIHLSKYNQENE